MRRLALAALLVALALAGGSRAAGPDRAGAFDYFLLAISWSPSWCVLEGDARAAPVCAPGSGRGFTLHGLWPQHEEGWPEFCPTTARDPTPAEKAAMADIMGSAGLARHQWVKHGRCTGLEPPAYFALARSAFAAVRLPEIAGHTRPADIVEQITALNPGLPEDGLVVVCREGLALEVRLCLDRALNPRSCAADVLARSCPPERPVHLPPPR